MTTPAEAVKPRLIDRIVGPSPREQALDKELSTINAALEQFAIRHENFMIDLGETGSASVHEALKSIDLMVDAQGWTNIYEYDDDRGLTLRQVKEASRQLRELRAGNPFIQNGYRIGNAQTWGGGVEFSSRLRTGRRDPKPLPTETQKLIESPLAQRYVFGNKAHGELQSGTFTDGTLFILGRDTDKQIQRIQIQEITGMLHNPNNSEEVWAYRREWVVGDTAATDLGREPENPERRVRWYYTDMVPPERRKRRIKVKGGNTELAEVGYTMIDMAFNRQIGWALGVPDALCVIAWARLYKEFLVNGYVMSRSLARLAYKITVSSAQAGNNAATTIATPGQSGGAYIEGSGNQLTPLATAGKGYDFSSGTGLAAAIAAGLGVSVLALTANPSAASGSNAAAQTLDPIAKATAAVRRQEWNDEFVRLFRWLGMDRTLVVTWHDLPEDTLQRLAQAWTLVDNMEVFDGAVLQREIARIFGVTDPGTLPAYWKPASQRKSAGSLATTGGNSGATDGSGQGSDDGSGDSQDDHDDDTT